MAIQSTVVKTKFQLQYSNKNGTYTFSGIKNSNVSDDNILATAQAFASVQKYNTERIFKIVDSKLSEV